MNYCESIVFKQLLCYNHKYKRKGERIGKVVMELVPVIEKIEARTTTSEMLKRAMGRLAIIFPMMENEKLDARGVIYSHSSCGSSDEDTNSGGHSACGGSSSGGVRHGGHSSC